ncbi:MAG: peptidylprolyl isomerase [Gammaproteobacteria bacterium]|nr:peptidylprolyl isomerase [Gammaproteobacteria bacterium]MBV8402950.1 peptidylprolyl isomerase [Gammaproteobacteria bacterium]
MRHIAFACSPWMLLGLAGLAVQGSAHGQTRELATQGELLDRVVAIVNDGVVLNSDLDAQVDIVSQRLRQQKLELPPQNVLRQQVLERLVLQEIQVQRAAHAGVKVPDEMLNAALQDVAKRNGLTLTQLPEALKQQGVDYPEYREEIRREMMLQMLQQRDVLQHISVTPREIDQFLEKQAKAPAENNEYNVSHILIAVGQEASPAQQDAAAKRAQEVYQRAKSGEDFAKLAVAYSNSQTALEGGALGWRKGGELPTFLSDTIARLKPGEVSEPLRTPTGYHIIRLNEIRGGSASAVEDQVHVRHILMKTNELADDATVRGKLAALRERVLKGEDFGAIAQVTSQDPGSAAEGGDLGWSGPGTFAPEFEQAIAPLKDGEISEPFKSQYGWHIAQMLGHRRFDNSDEIKRRKAMEAIRASKADEETELWLRRMRDEAYVEYKS